MALVEAPEAQVARVPRSVLAGLAGTLVALAVGLVGIGRSFNYDEAFTYVYFVDGGSVRRALTTQIVFNNHPPFSAILAVLWRIGLVGETGQRLAPVAFGAATVGLVTWYTTRRVTLLAGLTAGALLLLNPVFLQELRSLRGYSLATLAVVLAGLAIERSWSDPRTRWLVAQGGCMALAVTTHTYSVLALGVFAVVTVALGRLRLAHVVTWVASAVAAVVVALPVLDDALRTARARGRVFRDELPVDLTRQLLGGRWGVALLVGALVVLGAVAIARTSRRHLVAVLDSTAFVVGVVAILWLVVRPFDLYVRFFITLLPICAYVAGRGVASVPTGAGVGAAVLATALLLPGAHRILGQEPTIREAAAIVDRARAAGLEVCGRDTQPLAAYTAPVPIRDDLGELEDCDVYVTGLRTDTELARALRADFGARRELGGGVTIWASPAALDRIVDPGG